MAILLVYIYEIISQCNVVQKKHFEKELLILRAKNNLALVKFLELAGTHGVTEKAISKPLNKH